MQQAIKIIAAASNQEYLSASQEYAEQMMEVLSAEPTLVNTGVLAGGYAERPTYRPVTKFENRGIRLGHGVWDLVFKKV